MASQCSSCSLSLSQSPSKFIQRGKGSKEWESGSFERGHHCGGKQVNGISEKRVKRRKSHSLFLPSWLRAPAKASPVVSKAANPRSSSGSVRGGEGSGIEQDPGQLQPTREGVPQERGKRRNCLSGRSLSLTPRGEEGGAFYTNATSHFE